MSHTGLAQAGYVWIWQRQSLYGWVWDNKSRKSVNTKLTFFVNHYNCEHSALSRVCFTLSFNHVGAHRLRMSVGILLLSSATSSSQITGPHFYFFTPGLLQLSCIWHHWQFTPKIISCTERCSMPSHRHWTMRTHITPVLRQLHWLPVRQQIEFKLAVLLYIMHWTTWLHNTTYYHDCQLIAATGHCHHLRLSDNFKRAIISTNSYLGDSAFADARPRLWNSLPVHICQPALTLDSFIQTTKDVFFSLSLRNQHLHCVSKKTTMTFYAITSMDIDRFW